MFKEGRIFNVEKNPKEPKSKISFENGGFDVPNRLDLGEALNLINEDCPGSREISGLDNNQKIGLFFENIRIIL